VIANQYDFFLSRRGSVADIAQEVASVLIGRGYKVIVQDYDFRSSDSVIERMHEGIKNARDLIILFSSDYEQSPYTRKEFTSFEALRLRNPKERHTIILRCDSTTPDGLLADVIYQDLFGVEDSEERERRIVAAAERQTMATSPPPRLSIGLPPSVPNFTGRASEIDQLDAILIHGKPAVVTQAVGRVAVSGLGGIGKTSLAVEYAHRYRNLYAGVCWCPAETRDGLVAALAKLGETLGVVPRGDNTDEAARAALLCLTKQRSNWLLIYDNVARPSKITDLLPSAGARVLITSRFLDWASLADEVSLDILSPEEAIVFLQTRAGIQDRVGAEVLAGALGYLPLALDHAAAFCKRAQLSFSDYANRALSLIARVPRDVAYPRSVGATFDLAISEAEALCASAEQVMAFLGYCAPARVPTYMLRVLPDSEEAVAVLAELSLLKHDPFEDETPAVTVHRLVQAVARQRTEARGTVAVTLDRISESLKISPPPVPQTKKLRLFRELFPKLRLLVHQRQLWRYQIQRMSADYEGLAVRYEELVGKFKAVGKLEQAEKAQDKANRLREAALRMRKSRL
jgi:hypothetical protein